MTTGQRDRVGYGAGSDGMVGSAFASSDLLQQVIEDPSVKQDTAEGQPSRLAAARRRASLYWASLRPKESVMMLGVPIMGALFGAPPLSWLASLEFVAFLLGVSMIAGHVYTLNDLLGHASDQHDSSKNSRPLLSGKLSFREVFRFSVVLLIGGSVLLFLLSWTTLVVAALIAALWAAYAAPGIELKGVPVLTSLINGVGAGVLPFLLGFLAVAPEGVWSTGMLLSAYFGIIAAAGQLNREIVDIDVDIKAGLRTTAVWLGRRRVFLLSFATFVMSSVYFFCLSLFGIVDVILGVAVLASVPIHGYLFWRCLAAGIERQRVVVYIERYRQLYLGLGVVMVMLLQVVGVS